MKSVLISIQPYWAFLIIAKAMGWNIEKEKTVEIRKSYPKSENWDKTVKIYCGKDKNSFAKIPKEYQPLMQQFLGKVLGEFVCDNVDWHGLNNLIVKEDAEHTLRDTCITKDEMLDYLEYERGTNIYAAKHFDFYGWHISELVIYDKPKELRQFKRVLKNNTYKEWLKHDSMYLQRPPQSWCYVEGGKT